jgi:hypothetical protein
MADEKELFSLYSAIFGIVFVFVGQIMSKGIDLFTYYLKSKDDKHLRDEANTHDLRKNEIAFLRDAYQNAIMRLALISSADLNDNTKLDNNLVQEAHKWIAAICVRTQDIELVKRYRYFTNSPIDGAQALLNYVTELASQEPFLFSTRTNQAKSTADAVLAKPYVLRLKISREYRKKRLVDCIDLPTSRNVFFDLMELSTTQRQKLIDQVFDTGTTAFPTEIHLRLPRFDARSKKIRLCGVDWEANVDCTSISEVMNAWEKDHDECLSKAIVEEKGANPEPIP